MADQIGIDLTFPRMAYGTHQVPWDLSVFLYHGGAGERRALVGRKIQLGELGPALNNRLALVRRLHDVISGKIEAGSSPLTTINQLEALWRFVEWVDAAHQPFTIEDIAQTFSRWADAMLQRVRVAKDITAGTASGQARVVADVIARALHYPHTNPGAALLRTTCLRPGGTTKKRALGSHADKQNLEATFAFGHLLVEICDALDICRLRQPLPFKLSLSSGKELILAGDRLVESINPTGIRTKSRRARAEAARAPVPDGILLIDGRRNRLLNLRVEAELSIFIAQTGMNLAQAAALERSQYRWQSDGEELQVFRVYKGRRGGEAIFRCFKGYREHLRRYISWLDEAGYESEGRLFPFLHTASIPPAHRLPEFQATRAICLKLGVPHIRPRALRKTKVNWLLRRSGDADLTADQAAHSRATLLRAYAEPNYQVALSEVVRFHADSDPTIAPPGPGLCAGKARAPEPVADIPAEAPTPDCISPEGCLFCGFHRDVLSPDYCWKLASHARLKTLELSLYKPPRTPAAHPAAAVIDRIRAKLLAIACGGELRTLWVRDAEDAVRAGRIHPTWKVQIEMLESMS